MNKVPKPDRKKSTGATETRQAGWLKPVLFISVIVGLFILFRVLGFQRIFEETRAWIEGLGPWGPLVFIGIYIIATVALLPGSPLSIAAGALFGSVIGVMAVIVGATLGAGLSFLVSRYLARDAVVRWLSSNERFKALDRMTVEHGAIIVALTRLVPLFPFNLLNYGFGLTGVGFWTYLFWSFLCMIPGTILYVVGADALYQGIVMGAVPWKLVAAFVAAFIFLTILVRYARRRLKEKQKDVEER